MAFFISGSRHVWSLGIVPFVIDDAAFPAGSTARERVVAAIDHWNTRSSLTLIPRSNEADYVQFAGATGSCSSPVGRQSGRQVIGCDLAGGSFGVGSIIHEIGHAVGLQHEQSRPDRDRFVKVNLDNVQAGLRHNFEKRSGDTLGAYDYESIMHYGRRGFAIDTAVDTLTPISWFGEHSQGAGVAAVELGNGPRLDLIVVHVDNPSGENRGYYRVVHNVTETLGDDSIGPIYPIPGWWGAECEACDAAVYDIRGDGRPDLLVFHVDNPSGENHGYYRIGWSLDSEGRVTRGWTAPIAIPGWFGARTQGGGVAIADLGGTGRPDLIVFHIDDRDGENVGYYRIGADLDTSGQVTGGWSPIRPIPGWFGSQNQGGGIAVADLDGVGRPDLVVLHIDNPAGENRAYVRIARDVDSDGSVRGGWSAPVAIPGWVGAETGGGGVTAADLNRNGTLDLVTFHVDDPSGENHGYLRLGRDLRPDGQVAGGFSEAVVVHNVGRDAAIGQRSGLSDGDLAGLRSRYPTKAAFGTAMRVPGWFGSESQGGDIAVGSIRGSGTDLVVFSVDNPGGENRGYYRVGFDLGLDGVVRGGWTAPIGIPGWFGAESQGGGVALGDFDRSGRLDLVVLHIDNPAGENRAFYRLGRSLSHAGIVTGGWTGPIAVPGWFGAESQGAGVTVADLNQSGQPDLIVAHLDNPSGENRAFYRVGREIDAQGRAMGGWSDPIQVPGWFGAENQGLGVTVAPSLEGRRELDLIVFFIDNPGGENRAYYRIGRAIDGAGVVRRGWTRAIPIAGWWGAESQGGGIATLRSTSNATDLVAFHVDNPGGENAGYYRVLASAPSV